MAINFTRKNFSRRCLEDAKTEKDKSIVNIYMSLAASILRSIYTGRTYQGNLYNRFNGFGGHASKANGPHFDQVYSANQDKFYTCILMRVPESVAPFFESLIIRMTNGVEGGLNSNYGDYDFDDEERLFWKTLINHAAKHANWKDKDGVEPPDMTLEEYILGHCAECEEEYRQNNKAIDISNNIIDVEYEIEAKEIVEAEVVAETVEESTTPEKKQRRKRNQKIAVIKLDPKTNEPVKDENGNNLVFDSYMETAKHLGMGAVSEKLIKCLGQKIVYHNYCFDTFDHYSSLKQIYKLSPSDHSVVYVYDSLEDAAKYMNKYKSTSFTSAKKNIKINVDIHRNDVESTKKMYDHLWFDKESYQEYLENRNSKPESKVVFISKPPVLEPKKEEKPKDDTFVMFPPHKSA